MSRSSFKRPLAYALGLPAWVFLGFILAQALIVAISWTLHQAGVSFGSVNRIVFNAVVGAVIYATALLVVFGVPWLVKKRKTTKEDLGVQRFLNWKDLAWTPAGLVVYFIATALVAAFAMAYLPFIDYNQTQNTGFVGVSTQLEYTLAFMSLVVVAPIAEELLFRGYLFGKLRRHTPLWISILITSLLFAIVHFQWNVGLDVFVLSVVLCLLRVVSGSIWPAILLHMLKNGTAYYFLFINPTLLSTLGG